MPRMQMLSATGQAAFDQPPAFDFRERKRCFDLRKALMDIAAKLRSPSGQIGFLLTCAYLRQAIVNASFVHVLIFKMSIHAASGRLGLTGGDRPGSRMETTP